MSNVIICNKCGETFDLVPERYHTIVEDGLTVEYFDCPFCLARYHVFTADDAMMELVQKRKALAQKIRLAKVAKARRKTILGYYKELEKVKEEQLKMAKTLNARGAEIMNRPTAPAQE